MKTELQTPRAPEPARDVNIDSTLIALTPAAMVGRPPPPPAPELHRTEVAASAPVNPAGRTQIQGSPREQPRSDAAAGEPSPALQHTAVMQSQSTGPDLAGRARTHGPELLQTLDRPLGDSAVGVQKTQISQPGTEVVLTAPPPPRIDRYVILRTLGEGGMGVVYAAYDEELDRKIAIKVLRDANLGGDASARMKREAQAMARLSHPNVVQIHDVGEHGEQIYLAMEFVKGTTLRAWQDDPHGWREVRDMFVQAGRGLAAAHHEDLVHRDFKPDNVLIGDDGRARVADFGLAGAAGGVARAPGDDSVALRIARSSAFSTSLTMAGTIMGTPAYMSPEQHNGEPTDARTDQFSFCVALWTALYGQPPFPGENLGELAASVTAGELRDPPRRDVPGFVHDALVVGLAVDPARRHPTMDVLLAALTQDLAAPAPASRWRALGLAIGGALVAALGVFAATRERPPSAEELAAIADLAAEARAAGEEAHWVYPPQADPKDTSILRVVALDHIDGPAERPARAEAGALRREFTEVLVELGDRYWDDDATRPFARDYYSQALVFQPDHPRARERGLYTPGQLAELLQKAERAGFSDADIAASELLSILADPDRARRDARLQAFVAERGTAVQRTMLAAAFGDAAVGAEPKPPKLEPEPPPEPEPPVVAVAPTLPEPVAPPVRQRTPKADKPDTKAQPPPVEPEEQLAQAAQDRARSDELVKEGEAARRRGDFDGAERLFNQALAAYSRNGAALMGLSDVEFDRGHFEQAVVFAERAVKAEPKKSDFRIRLGDAYFKVLRYPDAKSQYEKAAELGNSRAASRLDKVKEKIGE